MKSLVLTGYGDNSNLKIITVAAPAPGPDDVLIKASHAGLNPLDYKIRKGKLRLIRKLNFPHVMGNEVTGIVNAVGKNVKKFKAGDAVYARLDKAKMGAFAELVVEDQKNVALRPKMLPPEIAAGVPLVALTAWQCLFDVGKLQKGQTLLIHGGAGSVGRLAIQFAATAGAEVSTTASLSSKQLVESLGAKHFIDYHRKRFYEMEERYDIVLDLVGAETLIRSFEVVKPGGMVISIAGNPEPQTARDLGLGAIFRGLFYLGSRRELNLAKQAGAQYRYVFMRPDGGRLAEFSRQIDAGKLQVSIDKVFPVKDFAEAFSYQETGKSKGKVILDLTKF